MIKKNVVKNFISLGGLIFFIFLIFGSDDDGEHQCDDGSVISSSDQIYCYLDQDDDNYGKSSTPIIECYECPDGYVTNNNDCFDGNADAFPGSLVWGAVDRGDGSFDYNCDYMEINRWEENSICSNAVGGECLGQDGWENEIPNCGNTSNWNASCLFQENSDCDFEITSSQTQQCQ